MALSRISLLMLVIVFICVGQRSHAAESAPYRVLVVMSYEENNPWCVEIKEGIDAILGDKSELTYYFMNTKKNFQGGPQKAKSAWALYQKLKPDGVITADDDGKPLSNRQVTQIVSKAFGKPIIGANRFHVEFGALCAVVKTGQEQGRTAAKMLLKALRGTDMSQIPITRNYKGSRVINVTVMEAFKIKPKPIVLLGTELIKTKN